MWSLLKGDVNKFSTTKSGHDLIIIYYTEQGMELSGSCRERWNWGLAKGKWRKYISFENFSYYSDGRVLITNCPGGFRYHVPVIIGLKDYNLLETWITEYEKY